MGIDTSKIDLSDIDTSARLPMTDVEHRALGNLMRSLAERIGAERYEAFAIAIMEKYEEELRRLSPDGPALKFLAEHRARKEQGFG